MVPGPNGSAGDATEGVPVTNGETQPFLHGFAEDDFFSVVPAESEGVVAIGPS